MATKVRPVLVGEFDYRGKTVVIQAERGDNPGEYNITANGEIIGAIWKNGKGSRYYVSPGVGTYSTLFEAAQAVMHERFMF